MSARSYISPLQGFLFCPHVEFAFWPSEAMFLVRLIVVKDHSQSSFLYLFHFIRVSFTTEVPDKWAIVKVGKYE